MAARTTASNITSSYDALANYRVLDLRDPNTLAERNQLKAELRKMGKANKDTGLIAAPPSARKVKSEAAKEQQPTSADDTSKPAGLIAAPPSARVKKAAKKAKPADEVTEETATAPEVQAAPATVLPPKEEPLAQPPAFPEPSTQTDVAVMRDYERISSIINVYLSDSDDGRGATVITRENTRKRPSKAYKTFFHIWDAIVRVVKVIFVVVVVSAIASIIATALGNDITIPQAFTELWNSVVAVYERVAGIVMGWFGGANG